MTSHSKKEIVIIGNGISGITCARHIRKKDPDCHITVISSETDYFFSRTALMYVYMGHMKFEHTKPYEDWFWKKNKITTLNKYVEAVNLKENKINFSCGGDLTYDVLVIATGSRPNKIGWKGQDLQGAQGLYSYQDLQLMEKNTQNINRAVIVGGGLIGIEMAEMLHSRNIPVTFIVRDHFFWSNVLPEEEAILINAHIKAHDVDLRLATELQEIVGDENGRVKSVVTNKGEKISCEFVGLTIGVSPSIDFLKNSEMETERGVLVNEYFETSVNNVFAIGDCAQFRKPFPNRKPIEQVWYTGKMHGETLAHTICGNKTAYAPGNWFNSAKFFEIEYQTYGNIGNTLQPCEDTFFWQEADGKKCFRVVFDKIHKNLIGIHALGIRLRHEVCDRWITEHRTIEYVMENLREANFDPEFSRRYEGEMIASFNREFGKTIGREEKKGFFEKILVKLSN